MINTTARHGELQLHFAPHAGKTVLKTNYFRTPLQVMRAITDAAGCSCVYILSPTGGVVQGDRYDIHITLEPDTHALITTLAATKVYRMPDGCAVQNIQIEVKSGAVLEFVPDAMILFRDADFHQNINVTLHDGAIMILQDSVVPGRLASGEALNFRRFKNKVTVCDRDGLLLYEQQDIQPVKQNLFGLLGDYRCWASWYLLGTQPDTFCERYTPPENVLGSATRLQRNGINVRLLGHYWSPLARALDDLRYIFRTQHMNLPATDLRK